jgi:pimeloyl-ACP methyl ester carboxylesterase
VVTTAACMTGHDLQSKKPTVYFVHGMWHGLWCWDALKGFFPGFHFDGIELPQHGERYTSKWRLKCQSIGDYVDALVNELEELPEMPVLLGHSLGCLVIEAAVARLSRKPRAIILVAPTRHENFRHSVWDFAVKRRHFFRFLQLILQMNMWPPICTIPLCREMLFPDEMPDAEVARWQGRMKDESYLATTQLILGLGPKPSLANGVSVLVVGGGKDKAVRIDDVTRVAAFHKTEAVIFEDMPHDFMLWDGMQDVANYIVEWLKNQSDRGNSSGIVAPDRKELDSRVRGI